MQEKLGVHYIKNDEIFKSKKLRFPDDNTYIKSKNELNNYLEDGKIKDFKFYIENQNDIKNKEFRNDNEFKGKKNEINNIMDSFDEINIAYKLVNDVLDNQAYEKKLKSENLKMTNNFKKNLEKSIDNSLKQSQKFLQKEINSKFNNFTDNFLKAQRKTKNLLLDFNNELVEIKDKIKDMDSQLNKFKKIKVNGYNMFDGIEFEQKCIEKTINIKDSNHFFINDLKIFNTSKKSYKKLCFIKDEKNSSNEISFFNNSKKINEYELKINDELEPNNSMKINIPLFITNAQLGKIYKMRIYVIEQDRYISSPFDIIITINKEVGNKKEIKKDINNKINKKEIVIEKAEKIYNKLDLKNTNNDKEEKISIIKARELYNEFRNSNELDFSKYKEEEIINKIIELKFDTNNIKKYFIIDESEKKLGEIYAEFEKDYQVSNYIDEEVLKNKISELNFDKNKINEWIETFLINDGLYY